MSIMRSLAILSALLLGASLAHAGPVEDCNQTRDLKRQLRGCTAYIKQGKAAPANLATAYLNRANVYARRGKHKLAFADYTSAIVRDARKPLCETLATLSSPITEATPISTRGSTSWRLRIIREP